jgi:hypothetical protein
MMARDTRRDAALMLRRSPDAKTFLFGTTTTYCVLDDDEMALEEGTGMPVRQPRKIATIAAGVFSSLAREATVTIDGTDYEVREIMKAENGDMLRVHVA